MNIDFSKKPEGATHFFGFEQGRINSWWKVSSEKCGPPAFVFSPLDGEWVAMALIPNELMPIPDHKTADASGLPPIESTVRIVPGKTTIWDVAEQFVGVDFRLKAVFMLEETRMVAVENIGSGQCCCFWASMVRTPEQAKAEERMNRAIALYTAVMNHPCSSPWHRVDSERQEHFLSLVDAGWQQVKP